MSSADLINPESHYPRNGACESDIEPPKPQEENFLATDYYEILRIGPQADQDTIERVYRTLADRFHPDNTATGDPETFLRLTEAYETLSNPARRADYNALRQYDKGSVRFWLRGRDFFDGVVGGQNRRLAVLCLLYRTRIANFESQGLTILDLERSTGWTREEVTSALWYLCAKKWGTLGESTAYSITADGFDVVESKLNDRLEFRALATLCYYGLPAAPEDPANAGSLKKDTLPLDIGPARAIEGEVVADHYESLGIGPQADEEVIERVYLTLTSRFHPDNPSTGDPGTFLRIRDAYHTLSDKTRRAKYDALRERTKHSARFRLRGREFFDGIRGEQLRRLAVLCLLYRQAASDSKGLTVHDMEPLTGCTREELGSALWYLREKQWTKSDGYSEYRITADGFDIVEREAQPAVSPISNTIAPENQNSHRIVESEYNMSLTSLGLRFQPPPSPPLMAEAPPESTELSARSTPITGEVARGLAAIEEAIGFAPEYPAVTPEPAPVAVAAAPEPASVNEVPVPAQQSIAAPTPAIAVRPAKRVVLSMGGKGGVGKTSVMTGLAEWFEENRIPVTMLDLDTENKAIGSLAHFFSGRVPKINIHTPAGLDAFVDNLAEDAPVILADMGAGAGHVTHDWFDKMYPDVSDAGVAFTAIGVVTSDPASVESVLNWAAALQDRANYIVVRNHLTEFADFTYWNENEQAQEFRKRFQPAIIRLDYRLADLENAVRNHGVTLGQVANRVVTAPELQKASLVMRAQSYRRRMFAEFDTVKELLLP
jgi:curved DNA-binding protein CbpA/MinD-like ATPase involved in chromosome partitioning or flagellar assembly